MKGLFAVICRACKWAGRTDHPVRGPRDFCPKCGSADIEIRKP